MNRGELGAMGGEPGGRESRGDRSQPDGRADREGGAAGLFGRRTNLAR